MALMQILRKKSRVRAVGWLTLFLLPFLQLPAQSLQNLQTEELNLIYYSQTHEYIIPHIARSFLTNMDYYREFWEYQPSEPVVVFIEDFGDMGNGGATAVPRNFVYISMAPYLYAFEVTPATERMMMLMSHELTHVIAMDRAGPSDRFFRRLFMGKVVNTPEHPESILYDYLCTPRKFSPRWYHEGIAVYLETMMSGGTGRTMGAYDEMVFRSMIRDDAEIYSMVGLEAEGTAIDFQVGANSYLYGTRFFSYLSRQYGPNQLIRWVKRGDQGSRGYISRFEEIYDLPLTTAWADWNRFEHEWQDRNLERIRQNPVTTPRRVCDTALGSVSRTFFDPKRNKLYTGVKYPGHVAHLAEIDPATGEFEKLCDIKGASTYITTYLAWDPAGENLFFTTDNYKYRDLNRYHIPTGETTRLITDARIGDIAWDASSQALWGVRHEDGISTVVRLDAPYTNWTAIHAFPYGDDIYDLDIDPQGARLLGVLTHIDGAQELALFETAALEQGNPAYRNLFDFERSSPASFVFSPDGSAIYGTSYYTGVSNVFRYLFETDDMSVLTNAETGLFRPLPMPGDSLLVYEYVSGQGFRPGMVPQEEQQNVSAIRFLGQQTFEKWPEVRQWGAQSPAKIDLEKRITWRGDFDNPASITLQSLYPVIEGYGPYTAPGIHVELSNPIGYTRLALTGSWTFHGENIAQEERLHLFGEFRYMNWQLYAALNPASFYDLFGPTKTGRIGKMAGFSWKKNLLWDDPRFLDLSLNSELWEDLDELPGAQDVSAGVDAMQTLSAILDYRHLKRSQGAVDDEKGYRFAVNLEGVRTSDTIVPKVSAEISLGAALPMAHSSVWLRMYGGNGFGEWDDSFSRFYFGGFGNNWVDHREVKQYRTPQAFPGNQISEISGKNYLKSLLEWSLPPLRFREVGTPWFYARWAHLSLFGGVLSTNLDDPDLWHTRFTMGAQIDIELVLMSHLKSYLSFGAARSVDDDGSDSEEIMMSLKIL